MYGVIFDFLRSYVIDRHGVTWDALLDEAGIGYKVYFPVAQYPDSEIVNLAATAARMLKAPLPAVLEDFGHYVGPKLITYYEMFVRSESRTFEVLETPVPASTTPSIATTRKAAAAAGGPAPGSGPPAADLSVRASASCAWSPRASCAG